MIWVRLKSGVIERLGPRLLEWEHAVFLMLVGFLMLQPGSVLGTMANEELWGGVIFILGLVRFISLVINGIRQRVTASLRAIGAIGSSTIFLLIGIGYLYSGKWGVAAAFFPVVATFELFNYARAMRDVGRTS
jgi:hypothetical protein